MEPSRYQAAIYDWIRDGSGSAIVDAKAGSGKTTTCLEALKLIPAGTSAIFLAFNRNVAQDLQNRMPEGREASTFHSLGMRAWQRAGAQNCVVDDRKAYKLLDAIKAGDTAAIDGDPAKARLAVARAEVIRTCGSEIRKLVGLAKQRAIGVLVPDALPEWQDIIDHFGLDFGDQESTEHAVAIAREVLIRSSRVANMTIDFDDMLYMPLLANVAIQQYDWVFVDEAQDTNPARRELARRCLKPGGRLMAVGDPYQSIYGFTGADHNAMDQIREAFNCITLPLSISYRCSQAVVQAARAIVPDIEANPVAPQGAVYNALLDSRTLEPTSAILCRNTAPLISLAFELIGQGIGVRVAGRDIGQGLTALVKKMDARTIEDLLAALSDYQVTEMSRLERQNKQMQAQAIEDRCQCLVILARNLPNGRQTIPELLARIDDLFSDEANRGLVTLSTIHKAKGREWPRVYILEPELMPSRWARQEWEHIQETNLRYVAITRAKRELQYITGASNNGEERGI